MTPIKALEKKWTENFKRSPLVDRASKRFTKHLAHQLFYGKADDSYPSDYPDNFNSFYNGLSGKDKDISIDTFLRFLNFIGIQLTKEKALAHLQANQQDFDKLMKKGYYILKTLAHQKDNLDIHVPYFDNSGDLYFLLRIESGESVSGGQLFLFEDVELPELYNRYITIPDGYENDAVAQQLFKDIETGNQSYFITGKAGTGKSTFIHFFAQRTKKETLLLAFTGIAAINVGGATIHSFFRFPFKPLLPQDEDIPIFKPYMQKRKIIEQVKTIIIDEVSMLRADILEAMDFSLRNNGGNPNALFGGKQVLFVGDPFQLPPVTAGDDDVEQHLFTQIYDSEYFFDSQAYKQLSPKYFEFQVPKRQNDLEFLRLLDRVRTCEVNQEILDKLNARYDPAFVPRNEDFVITLSSTNAIAHAENERKLRELPTRQFSFTAEVKGEFAKDRFPTNDLLELKQHAQVIFIKNDTTGEDGTRRWVNGTIAKIDFIADNLIEVKLPDGKVYPMSKETWENRRYKYDKEKKKVTSEVIGTFTQYPIRLAWAITIHKSQGLTFDKVIIDVGSGAFVNGQIYTALSRCRKLEGIILRKKLRSGDIIQDHRLIHFNQSSKSA